MHKKHRLRLIFIAVSALAVCLAISHFTAPRSLAILGAIKPGETIQASLGNERLPARCAPDTWLWEIRAPNYGKAVFRIEGESLEISPLLAGARVGLWMVPEEQYRGITAWAAVGYQDYPPIAYLIESIDRATLETGIRRGPVSPAPIEPLDVEAELDHVAFGHDVVLAF